MATVKACSRPRTRGAGAPGAAKAEVARKSAALKSVSVRLRPRAPSTEIAITKYLFLQAFLNLPSAALGVRLHLQEQLCLPLEIPIRLQLPVFLVTG
jgi:hypothetical protein